MPFSAAWRESGGCGSWAKQRRRLAWITLGAAPPARSPRRPRAPGRSREHGRQRNFVIRPRPRPRRTALFICCFEILRDTFHRSSSWLSSPCWNRVGRFNPKAVGLAAIGRVGKIVIARAEQVHLAEDPIAHARYGVQGGEVVR